MNVEYLVSTMNCENFKRLLNKMKISNRNVTIINQITKDVEFYDYKDEKITFLNYKERGLSKSRNKAILNSKNASSIIKICDDDMYYVENSDEIIISYFEKYCDADIIAFIIDNENITRKKKVLKEGKIGYLKSMKLQSVQICIKKDSLIKKNIKFDEKFGAGSIYPWGEENIFLFDCLKNKMKIYYVPVMIGTLYDTKESTWQRENSYDHYEKQGAIYYRMSRFFYPVLILQFALRKRKIYIKDIDVISIIKAMFSGAKKYHKGDKNE